MADERRIALKAKMECENNVHMMLKADNIASRERHRASEFEQEAVGLRQELSAKVEQIKQIKAETSAKLKAKVERSKAQPSPTLS